MVSSADYRQMLADQMLESELQSGVRGKAKAHGWLFYHTYNARRSEPGFPDCVMVRHGRIVFAELKQQKKSPTPSQIIWLDALGESTCETYVWRPMDLLDGTIENILRGKP